MARSLVPKQRALTDTETQTSFESWREAMIFHISLDSKSARFLSSGNLKTWTAAEDRGFEDDPQAYNADSKMSAVAKASLLNIVLGSIATWAPVISPRFIKQQSTSLDSIWERLRSYYGFRKTGSRILELLEMKQEQGESREALWERLYTFMEDNLLTTSSGVKHEDQKVTKDEELTPTLLNVLVTTWLNILNPALPSLVRLKFSTQLRTNTVYSIRDEISDAVPTMLTELEEKDGAVCRSGTYSKGKAMYNKNKSYGYNRPSKPRCVLCETAGRSNNNHFLSGCPFLPPDDKKFMSRGREVCVQDDEESDGESPTRRVDIEPPIVSRKVEIVSSLILKVQVNKKSSYWTLDGGATSNLITREECLRLGATITPTRQKATQADGTTPLPTLGETHFTANKGHHVFKFSGLVVKNLDAPVLAGMPFLKLNNITVDYGNDTIDIAKCCTFSPDPIKSSNHASVLRVSNQVCILPGDEATFFVPDSMLGSPVAIEPRTTVPPDMPSWFDCSIVTPDKEGRIHIQNTCSEPILLSKHTQVCQARPTTDLTEINPVPYLNQLSTSPSNTPEPINQINTPPVLQISPINSETDSSHILATSTSTQKNIQAPVTVKVDPSNSLSKDQQSTLIRTNKKYGEAFTDGFGCYNGYSGQFTHTINVSDHLPPQNKGRIPVYSKGDLVTLQEKFDELYTAGIIARAEEVGVPVEYVHPSFLVKKPSGGERLVTSFGTVAEYARPQPTCTSNVEHVLHQVGQWKYLIKADLTSSYHQIPLSPDSYKYVGIMSPFKGTFVYKRSVMGLPGSESALEELLSRIFGDLIQAGKMIKLADDIYCGSDTFEDLVGTWDEVLKRLVQNGLKLSPNKTVCCPTQTTILGWIWEQGRIKPSSHRLNAMAACEPPPTVKSLRSFIGCFKFISRVLPRYSELLQALETVCGNRSSSEKINWTEELLESFKLCKEHLKKAKSIVLPKREEQLYITTDAAINCSGLAATLLVVRNGKPAVAGYYNSTLRKNQAPLMPCELEALAIGSAIKHFSYYISQSYKQCKVLTDSKPCVQSFKRLLKGEFSSSHKVTTFISIARRYNVDICHIPGGDNVLADYCSRNPIPCVTKNCDICTFIEETASASIAEIKVSDILSGRCKVPFTTRSSWLEAQNKCEDLINVTKYITTDAVIPKKKKNLTDVRRYISCGVTTSSSQPRNLLVIKQQVPFKPTLERIVIPRKLSEGLLTALHLQFQHPSTHQLKQIFCRGFFCLDMDSIARQISEGCHTCAALKNLPTNFHQQTTSPPSTGIGTKYSADVVRRYNQCICVIREDVSSFTDATIIPDEKADTLREAIIQLLSRVRSNMSPKAVIRTDPASALRSLVNDSILQESNLSIELGEPKNINKNPIAENSIRELQAELSRLKPLGGKISESMLAKACSNINSKIRQNNLSAFEIFTTRDMVTGDQLDFDDKQLIKLKQAQRESHHESSARFKARGKPPTKLPKIEVGEIVYLYSDRSKLHSRDKYLVTDTDSENAYVQKLRGSQLRGRSYKVKKSDIISVDTVPQNSKDKLTVIPPARRPVSMESDTESQDSTEESGHESPPPINEPEIMPVIYKPDRPIRNKRRPDYYVARKCHVDSLHGNY